jgi:RsiW-degrading membrane proteinase PrsW (M82 family)
MSNLVIPFIIATIIPAAYALLIIKLDFFKTISRRFLIISALAGLAAYGGAYFINPLFLRVNVSTTNIIRFVAPVVEEILKALILIYLVRRRDFAYFVEAAIYGFTIGIGFAIVENYQYLLQHSDIGLALAINRVISTNLVHATASSVAGVFIGLSRFSKKSLRIPIGFLGLILAVILHTFFNNMVTRDFLGGYLIIFAAIVGILGGLIIILTIKKGLKDEREWINETLEGKKGITNRESVAVQNLDQFNKIKRRIQSIFGKDQADQIERLLTTQAKIGIALKTRTKLEEEKERQQAAEYIRELEGLIRELQLKIGTFGMLYVRNTFPPEHNLLYENLSAAITARNQAETIPPKIDAFNVLGQKMKKPQSPEEKSN